MAGLVELISVGYCSGSVVNWISVPWICVRIERYSPPSDIGVIQVGLYCFKNVGSGYESTDEFGEDDLTMIIETQSMNQETEINLENSGSTIVTILCST